ncbi:MAG: 4Fe-4S dicluster domain-containing protein [Thermoplasmata archaeon]
MIYLLDEKDMAKLFKSISEEYDTYGTISEQGEIVFGQVKDFKDIVDGRSKYAPKEFLISRNENILYLPKIEKKAVFGIRSCDLKGFYIMDRQIYGKDPFYTARRDNTLFINFVCREPCEGGFCSSFGGPVLEEYQIQVIPDGGKYFVMVSEEFEKYMKDFKVVENNEIEKLRKDFDNKMEKLPVEGIENRIRWNSKLWKEYASICISCGACNFSCPTCYCFDLYDREDERLREWDSCILAGFTSSSAGNNRSELDERLRQRFYHKYVYYKKSKDVYLCTGCNRCTEDCPVDIDIKEVITHDYSKE